MSRRIERELREVAEDLQAEQITAGLLADDIFAWQATFPGPVGTPYEGGSFVLDITIPPDYPLVPPKLVFQTNIYHPNVSSAGSVCLDNSGEWSPAISIPKLLLCVHSLLVEPDAEDPLVPHIASQYIHQRERFNHVARAMTLRYAMTTAPGQHVPTLFELAACKLPSLCDVPESMHDNLHDRVHDAVINAKALESAERYFATQAGQAEQEAERLERKRAREWDWE
jgi:ubiquitin-conjugating enzyme E2 D/E